MTDTTTTNPTTADDPTGRAEAILRTYARSLDVMERAIRTADPARWDQPSPCTEWTAREVAGHSMKFLGDVVQLAGDGPAPDLHARVDFAAVAGAEPNVAWTAARHHIERELLTRPDRLANVRLTPLGVEMPMLELLPFQGMDPVVHAWDVAVTTGGDIDVPDDLARHYLQQFAPVVGALRDGGVLGPATAPIGTGALGELLGFCGRVRPGSQP